MSAGASLAGELALFCTFAIEVAPLLLPLPLWERAGVRGERCRLALATIRVGVRWLLGRNSFRSLHRFPLTPALSHEGRGRLSLGILAQQAELTPGAVDGSLQAFFVAAVAVNHALVRFQIDGQRQPRRADLLICPFAAVLLDQVLAAARVRASLAALAACSRSSACPG